MAIRDADMAILHYSLHDIPTFENIRGLPSVFELRKKVRHIYPPVIVPILYSSYKNMYFDGGERS